jgi:microcystin-dependent protein
MSQPYIGEIRLAGFNFAPVNWAFCNGALIAISQNETLFTLIGTTYGGDGQNTFALPNLQGRIPVHVGTEPVSGTPFVQGQLGGNETVTLTTNQIPVHSHAPQGTTAPGTSNVPTGNVWANWTGAQYSNSGITAGAQMRNDATGLVGGSQPHDNMMPFLAVTFIIALYGVYPSQS